MSLYFIMAISTHQRDKPRKQTGSKNLGPIPRQIPATHFLAK